MGIGGTPEGVISAAAREVRSAARSRAGCGRATPRSVRSSIGAGYDPEKRAHE